MSDAAARQRTEEPASVWDRLNMERVARRLIQTARIATAEHMMQRVRDASQRLRQDARLEQAVGDPSADSGSP